MSSKKYSYILSGVLVLLLCLIVAGTVAGNSLLQKRSANLTSLKAEFETLELQQTALVQAKKDVERFEEIDKIAKSVVPQDKDQAKTVREIVQIAAENDIPIKSITFQNSSLGQAKTAAPVAPTDGTAPAAPAAPPDSQVKAVTGIPGVFTLEIQVSSASEVSYSNFLKFLESLEKNRRTAHVAGINLNPSPDGTSLDFNLTLNAYLKP